MSTRLSNAIERPPSEQLSDLHVYVIPSESWNEKFRSAYNEVINESVSAGFVRVFPEITVFALRDEIEEQLGYDVLPKEYVFLKSVGRCLTQVKGRQEIELKVKNFLPPLAYLPEIFVLPGQRDNVPLALPSTETYKSQRHKAVTGGRSSKHESTQTGASDLRANDSRLDNHSGESDYGVVKMPRELGSGVVRMPRELGSRKLASEEQSATTEITGLEVSRDRPSKGDDRGVSQSITNTDVTSERQVRQDGLRSLKSKINLRISNNDRLTQNSGNHHCEVDSDSAIMQKSKLQEKNNVKKLNEQAKTVDNDMSKSSGTKADDVMRSHTKTDDIIESPSDKRLSTIKPRTMTSSKESKTKTLKREPPTEKLPLKPNGSSKQKGTPFKEWKNRRKSLESKPAELPRWQFAFKGSSALPSPPKKWERTSKNYKSRIKKSMTKHLTEFKREILEENTDLKETTDKVDRHSDKVKQSTVRKTLVVANKNVRKDSRQGKSVEDTKIMAPTLKVNVRQQRDNAYQTPPNFDVLTPTPAESEPVKKVVRIVSAMNQEFQVSREDLLQFVENDDTSNSEQERRSRFRRKIQPSSTKPSRVLIKNYGEAESGGSEDEERLDSAEKRTSTDEIIDSDAIVTSDIDTSVLRESTDKLQKDNEVRQEEDESSTKSADRVMLKHVKNPSRLNTIYESRSGEMKEVEREVDRVGRDEMKTHRIQQRKMARDVDKQSKIARDVDKQSRGGKKLNRGQDRNYREQGDVDGFSQPGHNSATPDPFSIEHHYSQKTPLQEEGQEGYLAPLSATPPQTPDVVPVESPLQRKTKVAGKDANRSGRSDTYTNNTNEDSGIADDVEEELERKRREQEEEERRRREEQERLRRLEEERREQRRRQQEEEKRQYQEEQRRREREDQEARERLERAERDAKERLKLQEEEREREELERQREQLLRLQEEQQAREQRERERRNREEIERRQRELEDQIREEEERKRQEEERKKRELIQKQQKAIPSAPEQVSRRKNRFDTDSAKERRRDEKERLLDDLQRVRQDRQDTEREREDLVRRAKTLQNRTQHKRNRARDAWKKMYFEEKKKTPPLEQEVNRLRHSLDLQHKKYVNQIEGKEGRRKNAYNKPSEKTNLKVQIAKHQHDLEELRRRVENTKMKLTTEMKLRNQAETELRALRAELTQKKINVTLSRSQQLQALQESEESMSYMSPRSPLPTRRHGGLSPRIQ